MKAQRTKRNYLRLAAVFSGAAALVMSAGALSPNASCVAAARELAAQDNSSQAAKPSLAGTWVLNKDKSDDPRQKMQQAMGNSGDGQGQAQGQGQDNPNRGEGRPGRGGGQGMMAEWSQLTVTQLDANVKITGTTGRTLATTTPPDDSANSKAAPSGSGSADSNVYGGRRRMAPPVLATWQGSQLVASGQGFGGGTTARTYELSPDGKQLFVTTKITNERLSQPVTYRLVYDKGSANSGNSQ
jgi:hypothetical protein